MQQFVRHTKTNLPTNWVLNVSNENSPIHEVSHKFEIYSRCNSNYRSRIITFSCKTWKLLLSVDCFLPSSNRAKSCWNTIKELYFRKDMGTGSWEARTFIRWRANIAKSRGRFSTEVRLNATFMIGRDNVILDPPQTPASLSGWKSLQRKLTFS